MYLRFLLRAPLVVVQVLGEALLEAAQEAISPRPIEEMFSDLERAMVEGGPFVLMQEHRIVDEDGYFHVWARFRNSWLWGQLGGTTPKDKTHHLVRTLVLHVHGQSRRLEVTYHGSKAAHIRIGVGPTLSIPEDRMHLFDQLWEHVETILLAGFWNDPTDVA